MVFQADPLGLMALVGAVGAVTLAAFVYATNPGRLQNRYLALMLVFAAFHHMGRLGFRRLFDEPASAYAVTVVGLMSGWLFLAAYLGLLSTLNTPLASWLRRRHVMLIVWIAFGAYAVSVPLWDHAWFGSFLFYRHSGWFASTEGWADIADTLPPIIVLTFAIVVAISAIRHARSMAERRLARLFAAAFVINDGLLLLSIAVTRLPGVRSGPQGYALLITESMFVTATILLLTILTYAILRHQLFDIDVRIKRGISRSTVAALFVAVFVAVVEVGSQFLLDETGSLVLGGVAIAALVLAIQPLQRLGDKVADKAMPGVRPVQELEGEQRLALYRQQLEAAYADGSVDASERRMLESARAALGIDANEAMAVESAVAEGKP